MEKSLYQMVISNLARKIRKSPEGEFYDAFVCSEVIAAAFCKLKEDVLSDLVSDPLNNACQRLREQVE